MVLKPLVLSVREIQLLLTVMTKLRLMMDWFIIYILYLLYLVDINSEMAIAMMALVGSLEVVKYKDNGDDDNPVHMGFMFICVVCI